MEGNDNNLSSYFHHFNNQNHHHQHQRQHHDTTATTTTHPSPTNGVLPSTDGPHSHSHSHSHMLYPPHTTTATTATTPASVPSPSPSALTSQSQLQHQKKKRGRPRKYASPEQALAARKAASASASATVTTTTPSSNPSPSPAPPSLSSKKSSSHSSSSSSFFLGSAGQDFTPHLITVNTGEDVGQKVMLFMQQSRRELCILSASGSISNASLSQPATSGGSITYEGRFEIISLNGSYVRNELGSRSGGLSVCLSNTDGQIIGGGVGGPLKAAGPVQVIVGTFTIDPKKDASAGKGDVSAGKPPVGEPVSNLGFSRPVDASTGNPIRGNEEHQAFGGGHFMIHQSGMQGTHSRPSEWGGHQDSRNAGFELTGRTGHGAHQSPDENGDYE
ncbi:hypothetical protein RIF29_21838 [Crotalaria pallida]|uniref:AT-hook motif nuclear-localized protein n=1 Tax=Crotalaria pallida TaxID=3830 RepID=A0AAN9I7J2_CROPI